MHTLWIFFLKKRAFTFLLMGALSLAGSISLIVIPKESTPEVIIPVGIVSTPLRGGGAEDTERLITDKLEDDVANLENIDTVTSSSLEGISIVTAQFNANADIDKSIDALKNAVDKAKVEFPDEASEPIVTRINFAEQPILILSVSADVTPAELAILGDNLRDEVKKVNGVSSVAVSGTRKREVQIVIKKEALEHYGLRIDQVIGAIQGANASFPIGSITVSDIEYPIKFQGAIEEPKELENITLTTERGVPVYLRDVALIIDGLAAPKTFSRTSEDGNPASNALTLYVFKKAGGDVTKVSKNVLAHIENLKGTLLLDSDVVVSFDNGEEVGKELRELTKVGLETVLLVMFVLLLTIGWRESLIAALSIPLSFVIAFTGLYASGNTINNVSLFSLILAIGILVDSGIVVVEAIHARIPKYGNASEAAEATIREYAWPLIAGTMATVVFFVPLFFISGIVGKFISSIPFTLIFVLMASIVVALGMVPLIAILLTKKTRKQSRFEEIQEKYSQKAKEWYKNFLGRVFDNRRVQNIFLWCLGVGFIGALALPIIGLVKVEFFPADDMDFFYIAIEKPEGTPLAITDLAARQVEEFLYENPEVESFVTTVGESSSFSDQGGGNRGNTKLANITVNLKKERDRSSFAIIDELREELSAIGDADITVAEVAGGPPTGAPVLIKFLGDDLDLLASVADKAERLLNEIPGTLDVETSSRNNGTQFELTIDRGRAGEVGLSALGVAQTLRAAVSGVVATTIKTGEKDIEVLVKLNLNPDFIHPEDTIKTNIDSIKQIPIMTPSGSILLGSLINASPKESRASIQHEDQQRIVSVSSKLKEGATALEVTAAFEARRDELKLPEGVTMSLGGENEEVNRSFAEMGLALLAGIVLTFAILVLEFNSFRYSLYLIFIIPLALIGVIGGLALSRQTLSFSSTLGVIALAGVIINHAIILLDSIIHTLKKETHLSLKNAIIEASAVRLRPIFLTTITTVIGMVPLAGASALWGPLAFAIMFGLTFAMVLTLILVPLLFYRWPGKIQEKNSEHSAVDDNA